MTPEDLQFLVQLVDDMREAVDILQDHEFEGLPDDLVDVADNLEVLIAEES